MNLPKEKSVLNRMKEHIWLSRTCAGDWGEDEDKDLEILISSMENIAKLLSMKMYEYGKNEQRMELVC